MSTLSGGKQHQASSALQLTTPHTFFEHAETRNVCAQNTNGALNEVKPHRKVDSCTVGLVWRAYGAAGSVEGSTAAIRRWIRAGMHTRGHALQGCPPFRQGVGLAIAALRSKPPHKAQSGEGNSPG